VPSLGVEFTIIRDYFAHQTQEDSSVVVGIGDDCALLLPSIDTQIAISVDTSIAGRHFPVDANAYDIAYRALNVSLSDLAAMGAIAKWFTLALTLPDYNTAWLSEFSRGLFAAAHNAKIALIGGDTTKGALSITVQVHGELPKNKALLRSGAKIGDAVYVSGSLGDAAAGLQVYQKTLALDELLLQAYLRPEPELLLGQQLLTKAHSCIDISDGFLADLQHILTASNVSAVIDVAKIPLSNALLNAVNQQQALQYALTGGDDYRLCFTAPEGLNIEGYNITEVGYIVSEGELQLINQPKDVYIQSTGYDHFYEQA
jgi:thiamine-monophosphate kinase